MSPNDAKYVQFINEHELDKLLKKLKKPVVSIEDITKLLKSITGINFNIHMKTDTNILFNNAQFSLAHGSNFGHIAACFNNINLLRWFIQEEGNVNTVNSLHETVLHVAVNFQSMDVVNYMLNEIDSKTKISARSNSPNLCTLDNKGLTPLHVMMTIRREDETYIKNLRKMTQFIKDINIANHESNTPAHIAALHCNCTAFKELLQNDTLDLTRKNKKNKSVFTIIMEEQNGQVFDRFVQTIVTELKDPRKLLKLKNDDGNNFLSCVVMRDGLNSMNMALEKWGDSSHLTEMLAEKNNNDHTPFDISVIMLKSNFVKNLIKFSNDKAIKNAVIKFLIKNSKQPTHSLRELEEAEHIITILLQSISPLDVSDGWNILLHVARLNLPDNIIKAIFNHCDNGVPIGSQIRFLLTKEGEDSPLHIAARYDHTKTFMLLLKEYEEYITTASDSEMFKLDAVGENSLNLAQIALDNNNQDIFMALIRKAGVEEIMNGFFSTTDSENLVFLTLSRKQFTICEKLLTFLFKQNLDMTQEKIEKFLHKIGKNGQTVAHMATCQDSCNLFCMLYDICPTILDIKNNNNVTVFELLLENGSIDTLRHIKETNESTILKWTIDNPIKVEKIVAETDDVRLASILSTTKEQEKELMQTIFTQVLKIGDKKSLQKVIDFNPELLDSSFTTEVLKEERSPLQVSFYADNMELVTELLKSRKNVNFQNSHGNTLMHTALKQSKDTDRKLLEILIDSSQADVSLKNSDGISVIELAILKKHDSLQSMLSKCQFSQLPCITEKSLIEGINLLDSKKHVCSLLVLATPEGQDPKSCISPNLIQNTRIQNISLSRFLCFQKGLSTAIKNEHGILGPLVGLWHYALNAYEWFCTDLNKFNMQERIVSNSTNQHDKTVIQLKNQESAHSCQEAFSNEVFQKEVKKEVRQQT